MSDYVKVPKKLVWTAIWFASKIKGGEKLADYMRAWITPKPVVGSYNETPSRKLGAYDEEYVSVSHRSKGFKPNHIMLHHTYGGWRSLFHWLRNKTSKVSYHYAVNTNGNRRQFVWDNWKAWHAGKSYWKGKSGMNAHAFGATWTGDTLNRKPTFEEIDSMAELCIYLMTKKGWLNRPLEDIIITHQDVAPKRKTDCARSWQEATIKRIKERLES